MTSEYYNNFTDFLDKYLADNLIETNEHFGFKMNRSYLWYDDIFDKERRSPNHTQHYRCGSAAFRVPGATRGHIEFDKNMMITDVHFYDDVAFKETSPKGIYCYKLELKEAVKEWIGRPVDLNGFTDKDRFDENGSEVK